MTVTQQLSTAVQMAKARKLTNPHICVRFRDDVRKEFDTAPLDDKGLRGLEVWITEGSGHIYGVVGDHEDGRKNVTLALPVPADAHAPSE